MIAISASRKSSRTHIQQVATKFTEENRVLKESLEQIKQRVAELGVTSTSGLSATSSAGLNVLESRIVRASRD